MRYTIGYARVHLSRLIREAEAGEEVIVMRRGRPVVRIVPVDVLQNGSPVAPASLSNEGSDHSIPDTAPNAE